MLISIMRKKRRNVDYSTKIDSDIDDAEKHHYQMRR